MDKLQQAIDLIRVGDKPGGQKLLAEVVRADPRNELAWLWLASVAPVDKRVYCLEKVLSINPANVQAQQMLEKLKASETAIPVAAQPDSLKPVENHQPAVIAQPVLKLISPPQTQYWTFAIKKEVRVILFQGTDLIMFDIMPDRVPLVLVQVNKGEMTKEWFSQNAALGFQGRTYRSIPFQQISRVSLFLDAIKVDYLNETGKNAFVRIDPRQYKISELIMLAFQKRLGDDFERDLKPISRWAVGIFAVISWAVTFFGSRFLYTMAQELTGRSLHVRGRTGLLVSILQFLGPNGVGLIGFILMIALISVSAIFIANPPIKILLVRKGDAAR